MSEWGEIWNDLEADFDAVFAEEFRILPRRAPEADVNARSVADPERTVVLVQGVFSFEGEVMNSEGRGKAGNWALPSVADKPTLKLVESALPYRPRSGDVIKRLSSGESYRVSDVLALEYGRLSVKLTRTA
jgi:hypothetical protein